MTVKSRVLVAALLLSAPVCYYFSAEKPQVLAAGINQKVTYTPQNENPMSNFKKTITTVFWVGEGATADNGYIDNYGSYWDAHWMRHFGGVDTPSRRRGYFPAAFTPKQNPFYIALPFAEVDQEGNLKEIAKQIPGFGQTKEPLTRNRWVEIRYKGKSCYAQWQDVGPSGEDDFDWVFGSASKPKNKSGLKAGLDISPAAAQFLGIQDSARTEWRFVDAAEVPDGPWNAIVTR
jgi:hypothetical protein